MNDSISLETKETISNDYQFLPENKKDGHKGFFYSAINGFRQAAKAMGNTSSLKLCLNKIYREYKKDEINGRQYYQPEIEQLQKRNAILRQTLIQKKSQLENLKYDYPEKTDLQQKEAQILKLEQQINELRTDPEHVPIDENQFNPIKWWTSLTLLILLGLYLTFFYISVSYSAFFKNILIDSQQMLGNNNPSLIFSTIFDVMALRNSLKIFNVFVLLFPFIFLTLGYLIHLLYEDKKFSWMFIIISVTFCFDALLAYKIGAQIHAARYLSGLTNLPFYNINLAIHDINVFAVLFAGFVVYLIWSINFHYFLLEWERSRPVKSLINQKKLLIRDLKTQIERLKWQRKENMESREEEIEEIANEILQNEEKIEKYKRLIETEIINWAELENRLDTFVLGWLNYLAQEAGGEQKAEERASAVSKIVDEFKEELKTNFEEILPEEMDNE